jgi:sec-independent protein translocase protein TatB
MSLPDTIFIFALALVIFGPKKLPEIGRQIGKLMFEFRRASNEFKLQIEEELRNAEAADRKAQAAAQTSAPPAASVTPAESPQPPESPESLTIRPPTTGAMVSAGPPAAGISAPESEPVSLAPVSLESSAPPAGVVEDRHEYLGGDLGEPSHQDEPAGEPIPNHHG